MPSTSAHQPGRALATRKISLSIPYKQRIDNLRLAFEGLARQSLPKNDFEVVVGVMEYADDYIALCREYSGRLDIVSAVSSREFHIPHARNLAMRQATGEILVQMDADILLSPDALRDLYDRHFSFGQNICVVGQVVGYGNNNDGDVESVEARSYEHHRDALAALAVRPDWPLDPRFTVAHVIPWAFGWTGLIALPLRIVHEYGLYFDEDFRGWGVDDLEWSYRICASGTPIVLRPDIYALHLPHMRDAAANRVSESHNYRRFLRKWPARDVELAHAFGDVAANALFLAYTRELAAVSGGRSLVCLLGTRSGRPVTVVGVPAGADQRPADPAVLRLFDGHDAEVLTLTGLALPRADKSLAACHIMPTIDRLSARYRDAVRAEAERVAKQVIDVVDVG